MGKRRQRSSTFLRVSLQLPRPLQEHWQSSGHFLELTDFKSSRCPAGDPGGFLMFEQVVKGQKESNFYCKWPRIFKFVFSSAPVMPKGLKSTRSNGYPYHGNHMQSALHHDFRKGLGIFNDILSIYFKVGLEASLKATAFAAITCIEDTLKTRENTTIHFFPDL